MLKTPTFLAGTVLVLWTFPAVALCPQGDAARCGAGKDPQHERGASHRANGDKGHKEHKEHNGHSGHKAHKAHPTYAAPLGIYETLREALAADDEAAARRAARAFTTVTWPDRAGPPGSVKASRRAAAAAAKAKGIKEMRGHFGDLSKALIGLLAASKAGAAGLNTYQCPMAAGYGKWLQLKGPMANPYMGKRMLACGHRIKLAP